MKKFLFLFVFLSSVTLFSQPRKVLLEEFSGAHCSQCPMGAWTLDSLLSVYPNLIGVSLHSYGSIDSMWFPQIDTIGLAYAPGAPLGAIDRIFFGTWGNVAELYPNWNARVQTRLAVPAQLSVGLTASWNSSLRSISTLISVNILNNMPAGDYRINLYVVEDSVIGVGTGYDQQNIYNNSVGNPFFGMGNPIVGYTHRHVVRSILPQAWGLAGIIPVSPMASTGFSASLNYTLPVAYDENKVKLVAFVSKYTANHLGDEVLNATESYLLLSGSTEEDPVAKFIVYPNPSSGIISFSGVGKNSNVEIVNVLGEKILDIDLPTSGVLDLSALPDGIYFVKVSDGILLFSQKILKSK